MVKSDKQDCKSSNGNEPLGKKFKPESKADPEQEQKKATPKKDDKKTVFQKRRLTPDFKLLRQIHLCVVPNRQERDGT